MNQTSATVPKKKEKVVEKPYLPPQELSVIKIANLLEGVRENLGDFHCGVQGIYRLSKGRVSPWSAPAKCRLRERRQLDA